jgi:hypothetical protein
MNHGILKSLRKSFTPFGLEIVSGDHCKVVNSSGRIIYHFGGSPSDINFARQMIRDLVRSGDLPKKAKRIKI